MGIVGVGGGHLVTLVRLGIGRFAIADPDRFEVANFRINVRRLLFRVGQATAYP